MYHYTTEMLVRLKQVEIEKKANESWKFAGLKQDSFFKRIFSFKKKKKRPYQNNCVSSCKC